MLKMETTVYAPPTHCGADNIDLLN